ncbi:uncharacterized protein LOC128744596 [Sabethes cyaneus]|uniref:uncharacterized protein LOC128744596 n=1 Tax=Sabethes cyaneus TaxID=53552 RepID=UPI00237E598A|nr:uncharacterized protein LOC128744596 [Sabethes cyaneus]
MGTVECPVCTLYLRADMSLEAHLETHPSDKVIKALVAMVSKTGPPAESSESSSVVNPTPANALEMTSMPACSSRSQTPPNALMYHSSGYDPMHQAAPPPPPAPLVTNSVPTAITVVKASDVGYPINNVMIVKSCSTKFLQPTGNPAGLAYASGSIGGGKGMFLESDRGGTQASKTASITVRRQLAPSLYPRYTNERYSGPPPPYSTAISSTISTGSQLQQSTMTGISSKYEQRQPVAQTIAVTQQQQHQQQYYQTHPPPPPPPPPMLHQSSIAIHHQQQQQQQQHHYHQTTSTSGIRNSNFLQAQYTEKEDGNFVVTENPKKIVEYTENDEGDFMVIEKIIKPTPRVVQIPPDDHSNSKLEPTAILPSDQQQQEDVQPEPEEVEENESEYEMDIEEDELYEGKDKEDGLLREQPSTIEIVENEDGSFNDNRGSHTMKEMPKPIMIGGNDESSSSKKYNRFNFIVESYSSGNAGHSSNGSYTPKKKPASGLKVLSNVKVTTDLSQGIKDIILNLNSKNKAANVAGNNSGNTSNASEIGTSLISGVKQAAVVNNNCQNELIINTGGNMPPIDLNNVNDIEIINDDEEDVRSGEEEECYVGSMEVKASISDIVPTSQESQESLGSSQSASCASRTTPTPSVITSVIRMTPHTSPAVAAPTPTPPPLTHNVEPSSVQPPPAEPSNSQQVSSTIADTSSSVADHKSSAAGPSDSSKKIAAAPPVGKKSSSSAGPIFNKQPKKLTVKLKTPLPPVPPATPPLASVLQNADSSGGSLSAIVPKIERTVYDEAPLHHQEQVSPHATSSATFVGKTELIEEPPSVNVGQDDHDDKSPRKRELHDSFPLHNSPMGGSEEATDLTTETITTTTLITTKVEKDTKLSETIIFTQSSSTHCSSSNSSNHSGPPSNASAYDDAEQKEVILPSASQDIVPTTIASVECYKITFIDDDDAVMASSVGQSEKSDPDSVAVGAHEIVAAPSVECDVECQDSKAKLELDIKQNISGKSSLHNDDYSSPVSSGESSHEDEAEKAAIKSTDASPQSESILKKCIKIEKVDRGTLDDLVTCTSVSSVKTCGDEHYRKDQKDLLEAGPSSASTSTTDGNGNVRSGNVGPTFLEYCAEYDDYVPVAGYGMPQEQIPLSWVQKFSPQYAPFEDQNSYMDLDMCSNKTNSNSVGENSATSASGSGSMASRVDNSMDRAPSAESLNIRTDEKMPAKGEISEQESNGDMELSWNRLYPVHENIPIYPSSYDMSTAQECWNLTNRGNTGGGAAGHSSNSSASNNNNSTSAVATGGEPSGTGGTLSGAQQDRGGVYHPYHHQSIGLPSHGLNFQFPHQYEQHRSDVSNEEDKVDDKSKIFLDYGAAGNSGLGYHGLGGAGNSSGSALHDEANRKLAKIRTYRCTECPKSFTLLKQRRAHMLSEHQIDCKREVLGANGAVSNNAGGIPSTVTSGSALGLFSGGAGEGSSTALLAKKIKLEPQPMLMSYSSLKQELELKREGGVADGEMPGPSGMGSRSVSAGGEVRRRRTYVCGTCKQVFARFKLFNVHLMTHPAECYTCGKSFRHWPNFALHIKRHLGIKDHQCRLCGKKFVIKQKLDEHMRVHTGKAPLKCPDCDQHFRRFSNLAQHRNRHHLNKVPSEKDFVCHCGEVFQSKAKMEWHKEIHENRPKSCPFCREKFIHKNSLTRHIRLSHTEKYVKLEIETETCTICQQPYIKTSMKRHMETHTEERMAYSCAICNKLFTTNWNLKQHQWTHANPTLKPFQCSMCSSGFVREADYITHMNAHKSIRPYTCNHCGCQFIRKYNWIRHTREHESDKKYTCEICGRKFHRKYYLKEHKRIHTGERPFSCNICGKTSSTKTNHNKHIKIHHARDPLTAEN